MSQALCVASLPKLASPRQSAGIFLASPWLLAAHQHRNQGPRNIPVLFCF